MTTPRRATLNALFLALVASWLCVHVAFADAPAPGRQVARAAELTLASGAVITVRYWLFVPATYTGHDAAPLILFLHGAGERGDDLERVKKWGLAHRVESDPDFPFVVVSPQAPRGSRWDSERLALLVEHVAGEHAVDRDRLYVTGLSMGGYGTWALVTRYPDLFAAAVPICGGGNPARADRLKDLPIWAFHGAEDRGVPVERSRDMVTAIERAGGRPRLTVYPGVGHASWIPAYADPELYRWLLSQRRGQAPTGQASVRH